MNRHVNDRTEEVIDMLEALTGLLTPLRSMPTEDAAIRAEWEHLLQTATSAQERDEINDLFGRSLAA